MSTPESYPRSITWPYVVLVVGIFFLTVYAPQAWRSPDPSRLIFSAGADVLTGLKSADPVKQRRSQASLEEQAATQPPQRLADDHQSQPGSSAPQYIPLQAPVAGLVKVEPPKRPLEGVLEQPSLQPATRSSTAELGNPEATVDSHRQPPGDSRAPEPEFDSGAVPPSAPTSSKEDTQPPAPPARPVGWPESIALRRDLDKIKSPAQLANWARQVDRTLCGLQSLPSLAATESLPYLQELRRLSKWPSSLSGTRLDRLQRQHVVRLQYAIWRRVELWSHANRIESELANTASSRDPVTLLPVLRSVAQQLQRRDGDEGHRWCEYLALAELSTLAQEEAAEKRGPTPYILGFHRNTATIWKGSDPFFQQPQKGPGNISPLCELADTVLHRMHASDLTPAQRKLLGSTACRKLASELSHWATQDLTLSQFLADLETYEWNADRHTSLSLVRHFEKMHWSPQQARFEPLMNAVDQHYRNGNVRVAVSSDLINRLMPALHTFAERVNDQILGAHVHGRNVSRTALSVRLVPDDRRIRMNLEARGQVQSHTTARKGPVTLYNRGESVFQAGKQLVVEPQGIYVTRAQAEASGGSHLIGLDSDYDDIPVVGWLIRLVARQQHDDQRPLLRAEVRRRVRQSATSKMDHEMHHHLAGVEQRLNERLLDPLNRLRLNPRAVEMRTTQDRVILRGRLASPMQLAAHTPRPQARKDSLLSLQIHESAANNLIQRLDLDGRKMSLEELVTMLSSKLGLEDLKLNEDVRKGVTIQFAKHEPLRFQFDEDRVLLTIHVAELDNGRRVWRDFAARAYYRADVSRLEVELERDGAIQLLSEQLGLRDQLALRGIFTKVLARSHRLRILEQAIAQQPRLNNLVLTQCVVRDGWIGLSLGDQPRPRVAAR